MANQELEDCKEISWILLEASRLLKVSGSLILGVPNLGATHNKILLVFGLQPRCIRRESAHIRGFTKPDMIDFLSWGFPGGFLRFPVEQRLKTNFRTGTP